MKGTPRKKIIAICPICKKEFEKESNARKYCSKECAKEANLLSKRAGDGEYQCAHCGKFFKSDRRKKFCSEECRSASYRKTGRKRKKSKSIEEVAKMCRETGLSYGQLMTQRGYDI